jgi:hypothetical protein
LLRVLELELRVVRVSERGRRGCVCEHE